MRWLFVPVFRIGLSKSILSVPKPSSCRRLRVYQTVPDRFFHLFSILEFFHACHHLARRIRSQF
ncbi:hypothetical protein ATPR_3182 [Acetobacter tropicalis NBRC 101654]|uniref:Uncharacterized protein n=1 Tax=Acetobacter tropicalis NBRC 101654 TaxID=749388 RepID=F7VII4_9PROT|nr:hypothetical protein ATPR_3182 [Acetobacter tropicalis NBRC 101654]